jgi:hypothetical protein
MSGMPRRAGTNMSRAGPGHEKEADHAGTIHAVVSTIGLFGIAFPALVGAVADSFGLTIGLGVYAAIGPLILVLLLMGGEWRKTLP